MTCGMPRPFRLIAFRPITFMCPVSLCCQDFAATVRQALDAGSDEQKKALLKDIWERVCVNGSAVEKELRIFLETMGAVVSGGAGDSAFHDIMADMDSDGDGQIDFDEFVEWFLKQNGGPDAQLAPVLEKLGFTHYAEVRTPRTIRP